MFGLVRRNRVSFSLVGSGLAIRIDRPQMRRVDMIRRPGGRPMPALNIDPMKTAGRHDLGAPSTLSPPATNSVINLQSLCKSTHQLR
jgi:hypothetical protein